MMSNRLLTDSRILDLHYWSKKVTRTNDSDSLTFCKLIITEFVRRTQPHKMQRHTHICQTIYRINLKKAKYYIEH